MTDNDRPTKLMNSQPGRREEAAKEKALGGAAAVVADAHVSVPVIATDIDALYEIIRAGREVKTRRDAATHLLKLIDEGQSIDPETLGALYGAEKEITVATALKRALNKIRIRGALFRDPTVPYDRKLSAEETRKLEEEIARLRGLYDRFYKQEGAFDRKYERLEVIGEGGMARIFRAVRRQDGRVVAIKYLRLAELSGAANPERVVGLFRREGELLTKRLDHPHVVKGYEYGEAGGEHFIVLEHVQGGTLAELIKKGPPDFDLFRAIALQLCDAVGYVHRQGVIHRDIKPGNVLIDSKGVDPAGGMSDDLAISIKLADFGLAKDRRDSSLSRFSFSAGTDDFSSPQQLADARDVDERDDIFSLGKTFQEMLAGRTLKNGEAWRPLALADKGRSEAVSALICRCIAPEREARWPTVEALAAELKRIG